MSNVIHASDRFGDKSRWNMIYISNCIITDAMIAVDAHSPHHKFCGVRFEHCTVSISGIFESAIFITCAFSKCTLVLEPASFGTAFLNTIIDNDCSVRNG